MHVRKKFDLKIYTQIIRNKGGGNTVIFFKYKSKLSEFDDFPWSYDLLSFLAGQYWSDINDNIFLKELFSCVLLSFSYSIWV